MYGHGGHHGGPLKVAFADIMTAKMPFLLVMWIIGHIETTRFQGKHVAGIAVQMTK